jgi:hypothetical protein
MERVILESPYGSKEKDQELYRRLIKVNEIYGEFCMHDMIVNHNESPYASHLLYTRRYVLRDNVPEERKKGIQAGFKWRDVADRTVFYCDLGMSSGMEQGFNDVQKKGRYEMRWLPDSEWKRFMNMIKIEGLPIPQRQVKI